MNINDLTSKYIARMYLQKNMLHNPLSSSPDKDDAWSICDPPVNRGKKLFKNYTIDAFFKNGNRSKGESGQAVNVIPSDDGRFLSFQIRPINAQYQLKFRLNTCKADQVADLKSIPFFRFIVSLEQQDAKSGRTYDVQSDVFALINHGTVEDAMQRLQRQFEGRTSNTKAVTSKPQAQLPGANTPCSVALIQPPLIAQSHSPPHATINSPIYQIQQQQRILPFNAPYYYPNSTTTVSLPPQHHSCYGPSPNQHSPPHSPGIHQYQSSSSVYQNPPHIHNQQQQRSIDKYPSMNSLQAVVSHSNVVGSPNASPNRHSPPFRPVVTKPSTLSVQQPAMPIPQRLMAPISLRSNESGSSAVSYLPSYRKVVPIVKICCLGDPLVGKTSLVKRFIGSYFAASYEELQSPLFTRTLTLPNNHEILLQLLEFQGTEQDKQFLEDANGYVVVFDLSSKESFVHIDKWMEKIHAYSRVTLNDNITVIGNKSDLSRDKKCVTPEEMQNLAARINVAVHECTEYDSSRIINLFESVILRSALSLGPKPMD